MNPTDPADDFTPIDRPLMRSDLNDVREAVHNISQNTLAMYNEFRGARGEFRTYVAICAACTFFSVVAAVVSIVSTMAHAASREGVTVRP
jgi:hypothetical protein